MESQHGQRLGVEAERYAALQRDLKAEKDMNASDRQALLETHTQEKQALSAAHAMQLQVNAISDPVCNACTTHQCQ